MTDRTLPYYKWFWQDWRANRTIQRMSYIERGLYRELLDECWVEGSIPNDIESLADICGCPEEVMANAWQVLSKCFFEIDGVLINEKLHSLRTEKDKERAQKSLNGKKGGLSKALKSLPILANPSKCQASAKQVSYIREEKRREEKINISSKGFEEFWIVYDKKVGKPNAIKEWTKAKIDENLLKTVLEQAQKYARAVEKKFRKDPERWIKYRGWEDEIVSHETLSAIKDLPLGSDSQVEYAYRVECGGDPSRARFNSYAEMRKFVQDFRDKKRNQNKV